MNVIKTRSATLILSLTNNSFMRSQGCSIQPPMAAPPRSSLEQIVTTPVFASAALGVIRAVAEAADRSSLIYHLESALPVLGADCAIFAAFLRDGDQRDSLRITLAGQGASTWCQHYDKEVGWFGHDAWLLYAATHSEPIADSALTLMTSSQRSARALAAAHGVNSAYIVPAPCCGKASRVGVLILGSEQAAFFEGAALLALRPFARTLAMDLHEWWVRKFREELIATHRLTREDLFLLTQEAAGRTTKQIAGDLGATRASIDSRFARLNAKFGTPHRKATARLAVEYGVI